VAGAGFRQASGGFELAFYVAALSKTDSSIASANERLSPFPAMPQSIMNSNLAFSPHRSNFQVIRTPVIPRVMIMPVCLVLSFHI
jgi:hypothetical protein